MKFFKFNSAITPGFGILLGLILFLSTAVHAQHFRWSNAPGNTGDDSGKDILTCNDGNILNLGFFRKSIDVDPGPAVAALNAPTSPGLALWKCDTASNVIWAKQINGSNAPVYPEMMVIDEQDNIYLTGTFENSPDFDPGPGTFSMTSGGFRDGFVVKLDSNGSFIWAKQFTGPTNVRPNALAVDTMGGVYVIGDFRDSADFDPGPATNYISSLGSGDLFVCKLDSSGQLDWVHTLGTPNNFDYAEDIVCDNDGNLYITTWVSGLMDYDPGPGIDTLDQSQFYFGHAIWKLDSDGQHKWVRGFSGNGAYNESYYLSLDAQSNVYGYGYFEDSIDIDPGPNTQWFFSSPNSDDLFLFKLDSNGNYLNGFAFQSSGNNENGGIYVDSFGSLYLAGQFSDSIDIDPGSGTTMLVAPGNKSSFLAKYNPSFALEWAAQVDIIGNGNIFVQNITLDSAQQIYMTGRFAGVVDADPGPGMALDTSLGQRDILVIKLGQCVQTISTIQPVVCDSFVSPSGAFTFTSSGTYLDTIPNAAGCDSVITIDLTVNSTTASISPVSCGPYLSPAGNLLSTSGTYTDTLTNAAGCDSLLSIQLTVVELDSSISQSGDTLAAAQDSVQYQWVNCDSGFAAIAGANQQQFVPAVSGNYAVIVTGNGCSDTSACMAVTVVGFEASGFSDRILVYPNPVRDQITLELPTSPGNWELELRDLHGRLVKSLQAERGGKIHWSIDDLPSGVYLLNVFDANGNKSGRERIFLQQ